jgi:GNAT superfamily N-acetyltransferase
MTMEPGIRYAGPDDVPLVTRLINTAFEVERAFKNCDRTTPAGVQALLSTGVVLIAESDGAAAGSAYVELRGDRVYIGMVAVDPRHQGSGVGWRLMKAAEAYGRAHHSIAADITVVSLRTELLPFYQRLGYVETGTAPFPDRRALTVDCHLLTMSKPLGADAEIA